MESLRKRAEELTNVEDGKVTRNVGLSQSQAAAMSAIPVGTYTLHLVTVSDPMENKYNPKIPRCKFTFEVEDFEPEEWPQEEDFNSKRDYEEAVSYAQREIEEMVGKQISWTYSMSLGAGGNLYPVYRGLYGKTPPNDHIPDLDLIEGRRIEALVQLKAPPSDPKNPKPQIVAAKPIRNRPSRAPKLDDESDMDDPDNVPF